MPGIAAPIAGCDFVRLNGSLKAINNIDIQLAIMMAKKILPFRSAEGMSIDKKFICINIA
jgi:hypothetical protein